MNVEEVFGDGGQEQRSKSLVRSAEELTSCAKCVELLHAPVFRPTILKPHLQRKVETIRRMVSHILQTIYRGASPRGGLGWIFHPTFARWRSSQRCTATSAVRRHNNHKIVCHNFCTSTYHFEKKLKNEGGGLYPLSACGSWTSALDCMCILLGLATPIYLQSKVNMDLYTAHYV